VGRVFNLRRIFYPPPSVAGEIAPVRNRRAGRKRLLNEPDRWPLLEVMAPTILMTVDMNRGRMLTSSAASFNLRADF
jgi:hypothetical protein